MGPALQGLTLDVLKDLAEGLFWTSWSTYKQIEIPQCIYSIVATDALVPKHQAISIHSAGLIFIVLDQFHTDIHYKQLEMHSAHRAL